MKNPEFLLGFPDSMALLQKFSPSVDITNSSPSYKSIYIAEMIHYWHLHRFLFCFTQNLFRITLANRILMTNLFCFIFNWDIVHIPYSSPSLKGTNQVFSIFTMLWKPSLLLPNSRTFSYIEIPLSIPGMNSIWSSCVTFLTCWIQFVVFCWGILHLSS